MNFEELFSLYPCYLTETSVKEGIDTIIAKHFNENNVQSVWKQCLHQIDLTTLNGDDTIEKVVALTTKVNDFNTHYPQLPNVAAICVYPSLVETVKKTLNKPIGIASVAAGFPASQTFPEIKVAECAMAVAAGATEVDIVISIGKFLEGNYQEVYDEIAEIKSAIHGSHLKVILETGALKSVENIYRASILAMAAGADFIKTSTGKITTNATPEATYVMCHAIKDWKEKTGQKVCYKPAGGVSTTEEAVLHYTLVKDILGNDWLNNESFRFGASRLANNLLSSILGQEIKYF
ncbi:MAG: deoxyribose-phosphate aldolase [Paludibacteraceae bacterium]|nr:deoxyribose-phosphate aldolase [Paludibacteraceae bacterium]